MAKVSIIIPTFNELSSSYIQNSIPLLTANKEAEVIVIDRNSNDGTSEFLQNLPVKIYKTDKNTRAARLNEGFKKASSNLILFHHPRSILSIAAYEQLFEIPESVQWGAFTHQFDLDHPLLNFTSWYSNHIRGDKSSIYYLDHCIFFRRNLLKKDELPMPEVDVFEDTELCLKLRKKAKPVRLTGLSTTSSIRFRQNGIYRQALLNQFLKVGFHFNFSKIWMNKIYEKGLSLNSTYKNS